MFRRWEKLPEELRRFLPAASDYLLAGLSELIHEQVFRQHLENLRFIVHAQDGRHASMAVSTVS